MLLLTAANGLDGAFLFFCALDHTLIRLKSFNVDTWLFERRLESHWKKEPEHHSLGSISWIAAVDHTLGSYLHSCNADISFVAGLWYSAHGI
jgi:hypothetical protein